MCAPSGISSRGSRISSGVGLRRATATCCRLGSAFDFDAVVQSSEKASAPTTLTEPKIGEPTHDKRLVASFQCVACGCRGCDSLECCLKFQISTSMLCTVCAPSWSCPAHLLPLTRPLTCWRCLLPISSTYVLSHVPSPEHCEARNPPGPLAVPASTRVSRASKAGRPTAPVTQATVVQTNHPLEAASSCGGRRWCKVGEGT